MNKAEAREKIKERIKYLTDYNDEVAEVYIPEFMDILQLYADKQSREVFKWCNKEILGFYMSELSITEAINSVKSNQEE